MSDEKIPGPVRSHAGDYLEVELQEKLMGPSPAAFAGVGSLVAAALAAWVGLGSAVVLGAACILGSLLLWVLHSRRI